MSAHTLVPFSSSSRILLRQSKKLRLLLSHITHLPKMKLQAFYAKLLVLVLLPTWFLLGSKILIERDLGGGEDWIEMIREKQNCQWCWKGVLQRQTMKTGEVLYRSEVVEVWCSLVFCYLYNRYLIPFSIEAYFERHLSLKKLCLPLSFSY